MYNLVKVGIVVFLLLYPVLIYFGLNYFSPSQLGIFFLVLFVVRSIFIKARNKTARWQLILTVSIGGILAGLTSIFNTEDYLLWYPVGLNIAFFIVFTYSIFFPPTVIEQLARVLNKDFPESGVTYTRNVTIVWSLFFALNAMVAAWTVIYGTIGAWTLYNGFISYLIVGVILGVELIIRKYINAR